MENNKVKVRIYGQEYTIAGERDEETIRKVADHVNEKMRELGRGFSSNGQGTLAVLTALNIAEPSERTVLDLGRVECMAKVYVNDTYAGGVWCEPFKVDISDYVKQGENTLRVEVVNKWVNRIVGDLQLPAEQRKISLTANPYGSHSDIPASGLIGPVSVEQY